MIAFNIYPNPASSVVNINSDKNIDNVSIINLAGQVVLSSDVNANNAELNISTLSNGTYIVRVISEGKTSIKKLVVE